MRRGHGQTDDDADAWQWDFTTVSFLVLVVLFLLLVLGDLWWWRSESANRLVRGDVARGAGRHGTGDGRLGSQRACRLAGVVAIL